MSRKLSNFEPHIFFSRNRAAAVLHTHTHTYDVHRTLFKKRFQSHFLPMVKADVTSLGAKEPQRVQKPKVSPKKKRRYDSEGARRTRIENRRRALLGLPKKKRQRLTNRPYNFSGKYRGKNGKKLRNYKEHFVNEAQTTLAVGTLGSKNNIFLRKNATSEKKATRHSSLAGKVQESSREVARVCV